MYMVIDRNENEPLLMSAEEIIRMASEFEYFHEEGERLPTNTLEEAFIALEHYEIYRLGDNNE